MPGNMGKVEDQELIELVRQFVKDCGTQANAAKKLGVSQPYIGELLRGSRLPGPKVLKAMGFRKVTSYELRKGAPLSTPVAESASVPTEDKKGDGDGNSI